MERRRPAANWLDSIPFPHDRRVRRSIVAGGARVLVRDRRPSFMYTASDVRGVQPKKLQRTSRSSCEEVVRWEGEPLARTAIAVGSGGRYGKRGRHGRSRAHRLRTSAPVTEPVIPPIVAWGKMEALGALPYGRAVDSIGLRRSHHASKHHRRRYNHRELSHFSLPRESCISISYICAHRLC